MIKLYVDIGNSAIKWATGAELRAGNLHQVESNKLTAAVEQAWLDMERPEAVYIASVRHENVHKTLLSWIRQQWQLTPIFAETRQQEHGVTNGYEQPDQLGVDRWLALLAARALSPLPQIVVDCGSATTIDAMDGDGRHVGGIILPGLRVFAQCLRQNTDIPPYAAGEIRDCFANDTASGIITGAVVAQCAAVEKLYQALQQREKGAIQCTVTGGDAGMLTHYLELPHQLVPCLVLNGLLIQSGQAGLPG
ncbi:type III pantothenate kinase [Candidatus Thiodiazotropha sp. CDECU1]|uniref:type III pantothenate kinase n=1 Tax=Candidatus Thiodiazotropha sp. CDECU1 TaxID=3065865 RepID=UPI002931CE7F|nr:type III pantothenate kinase [Candidatus Thiodiazotropha sp. CDECU1]